MRRMAVNVGVIIMLFLLVSLTFNGSGLFFRHYRYYIGHVETKNNEYFQYYSLFLQKHGNIRIPLNLLYYF
jgi:hypothetical protein